MGNYMKLYSIDLLGSSQVEQFRQIFIRWARYDPMHGLSSREFPGCVEKDQNLRSYKRLDGLF